MLTLLSFATWLFNPGPAFHLAARALPTGGVELIWDVPPATAAAGLKLRRAYDVNDPEVPVTTIDLPATPKGRYVDTRAADGVAYVYGLVEGQRIGVMLPDRALPSSVRPALWIDKAQYTLTVVAAGKPLKRYPIALGALPRHRKLAFDNASTPEGLYRVQATQPRARYHRAFDLDYPTALDRVRYDLERPNAPIGGEIQIHGRGIDRNWTYGCIALRNADMDELFAHPELGRGTEVRIWGGELTEADVAEVSKPHPAWRQPLARHGIAWDGLEGPHFWQALGRFQRASGLPVSCVPDARTRAALGR